MAIPYTFTLLFVLFTKSFNSSLFTHVSLHPVCDFTLHAFLTSYRCNVQGLLLVSLLSTSDSYFLLVNCYPLIRSTFLNHFKTCRSTLPTIFSLAQTLYLTFSFFYLFILVTLHILRKYFISIISCLCLIHPHSSFPAP